MRASVELAFFLIEFSLIKKRDVPSVNSDA